MAGNPYNNPFQQARYTAYRRRQRQGSEYSKTLAIAGVGAALGLGSLAYSLRNTKQTSRYESRNTRAQSHNKKVMSSWINRQLGNNRPLVSRNRKYMLDYNRRTPRGRKRIKLSQKGYVRTGGNYGRYSPGGRFQEMKWLDVSVADGTIATSGDILNSGTIVVVPQGTTQSERIGRMIMIKKILLKYQLVLPNSTDMSETSDVIRVILYMDKQCNGATATVADILQSASFQAFRALDNSKRFTILMDRTEALTTPCAAGNGTANDSGRVLRFKRFYKNCSIPIEYNSTTGAITEIRSNNLGILTISSKGVGGFSGTVRIRYEG